MRSLASFISIALLKTLVTTLPPTTPSAASPAATAKSASVIGVIHALSATVFLWLSSVCSREILTSRLKYFYFIQQYSLHHTKLLVYYQTDTTHLLN